MKQIGICVIVLSIYLISSIHAYSAGAPVAVCEDMKPKHPADPQTTKMPYEVIADNVEVSGDGVVQFSIKGAADFLGFLLEIRDKNNEPVGQFLVKDNDKYVKTINCGKGEQNAATHKNSTPKNNLGIGWKAPKGYKGQVKVFVTVAKDGGVFWVKQEQSSINII